MKLGMNLHVAVINETYAGC